jgi:DNA uptake protein ComE-like DNA-binding protein
MKQQVKNYLSITKKEWNGLVVLMMLILLTIITPEIYKRLKKDESFDFTAIEKAAAQLKKLPQNNGNYQDDQFENIGSHMPLFVFDPNNLPVDKWKQLGLSDHQINMIKHYEAKGGHFCTKEDLKKIYAITLQDYNRLAPYINIEGNSDSGFANKSNVVIELNTADSAKLTEVRGIGPVFAMRIIRYRDKLGGFYKKEQLKEVFGVDEEKYIQIREQLRVDARKLNKLNINAASFDDLRRFPYLSYKQMNAVIQYRKEHGDYESLDDMRNVAILDDGILRKIEPYLIFK